jgi:thiamine biosynthesis lipoprotein
MVCMKKKTGLKALSLLIILAILSGALLAGCGVDTGYAKYSGTFFGTFDTVVKVVGYARDQAEFDGYFAYVQTRFEALNRLFDIYNDYEGIVNLKTVNDNAGKAPVAVDPAILDLVAFGKEWAEKTPGVTDIAMGAVLSIWHVYRRNGQDDPAAAALPPMDDLREAAKHTDIEQVVVDREAGTIFLADPDMSLDVGAIAKGYATELVTHEVQAMGFVSGIISSGGNVRTFGKPLDGVREKWGVGIQDPAESPLVPDGGVLDTVYVRDLSVVTSGDYQRFYTVDGTQYNHIIDPSTLMPATNFHAVTVLCEDSGVADFLSTTLFILSYDDGLALIESLGYDALWVMPDLSLRETPGFKAVMKDLGGAKYN